MIDPLFDRFEADRLTTSEQAVYRALLSHIDDGGASASPTIPTLARELGVSDKTVRRALQGLEAKAWIAGEARSGAATRYRLLKAAGHHESAPTPPKTSGVSVGRGEAAVGPCLLPVGSSASLRPLYAPPVRPEDFPSPPDHPRASSGEREANEATFRRRVVGDLQRAHRKAGLDADLAAAELEQLEALVPSEPGADLDKVIRAYWVHAAERAPMRELAKRLAHSTTRAHPRAELAGEGLDAGHQEPEDPTPATAAVEELAEGPGQPELEEGGAQDVPQPQEPPAPPAPPPAIPEQPPVEEQIDRWQSLARERMCDGSLPPALRYRLRTYLEKANPAQIRALDEKVRELLSARRPLVWIADPLVLLERAMKEAANQ